MPKVGMRRVLSSAFVVALVVLTGCSSPPELDTALETTTLDYGFINTASARDKSKQAALNKIFSDPLTRDATAAIKRTGITVEWTYPLPAKQPYTVCTRMSSPCGSFVMIGKVNSTTSYIVNMLIALDGQSYYVGLASAQVVQTRKISSSRTIVSAADLESRTAVWVDANVSTGGLRTASASSSTIRLSASSRISGYGNLGKLLTVGGGSLAPSMCAQSALTVQCGGGGGGGSTTPPAPEPKPEPDCDKDACDSERYDARTANWKMAGAVLQTGGEVGAAVVACAAVTRVAPGVAKDACRVAAVAGAASVTNGVGNIRDANADKKEYQDCKREHDCVSCFGRDGYLAGEQSSWQSILG